MERGIWLTNICCNFYVYNFKVIAYQIVLDHCAQIIFLNQMIWSSMLMANKTDHLNWYKNSSQFLFINFFCHQIFQILVKHATTLKKITPSFVATSSKNWNPTELLLFKNLVGSSTLPRRKGGSHYEIMINFKKIAKQNLNL